MSEYNAAMCADLVQRPVLLSGFGPFGDVEDNPSGRLARALGTAPGVRGVVLPVSFGRAVETWERALAALGPAGPALLLGTGVHGGATLRLERRARSRLHAPAPDVDGALARELRLGGPEALETGVDLGAARAALEAADVPVEISHDAGGYVCERTYRHLLERGRALGAPALFVHVPGFAVVPRERQLAALRSLLDHLRATPPLQSV